MHYTLSCISIQRQGLTNISWANVASFPNVLATQHFRCLQICCWEIVFYMNVMWKEWMFIRIYCHLSHFWAILQFFLILLNIQIIFHISFLHFIYNFSYYQMTIEQWNNETFTYFVFHCSKWMPMKWHLGVFTHMV